MPIQLCGKWTSQQLEHSPVKQRLHTDLVLAALVNLTLHIPDSSSRQLFYDNIIVCTM